jgi:hypothetical protein
MLERATWGSGQIARPGFPGKRQRPAVGPRIPLLAGGADMRGLAKLWSLAHKLFGRRSITA